MMARMLRREFITLLGGAAIVDPLADRLIAIASSGDAVDLFLQLHQIFPSDLASDCSFRTALTDTISVMRARGVRASLHD